MPFGRSEKKEGDLLDVPPSTVFLRYFLGLSNRIIKRMPARPSLRDRRKIGAYYTPTTLTDVLSAWSIRSPKDLILEPSFGGCSFLESCNRRMLSLGCQDPTAQLFGCDIDPLAFEHLFERLGLTQIHGHFFLGDFLSTDRLTFGEQSFDSVIGNPPYVRHHNIGSKQSALARQIRNLFLPTLNLRANLWAFFVLHACSFLKEYGRAAWLLPSSFAHADYAGPIRNFLSRHFTKIATISLAERLFKTEGADEATTIVLAEGWHSESDRPQRIHQLTLHSLSDLSSTIAGLGQGATPIVDRVSGGPIFKRLHARSKSLAEFCSFLIGTVTGDNRFFLFSARRLEATRISRTNLKLIASRATHVPGLTVTRRALMSYFREGAQTRILYPRLPLQTDVLNYLKAMPDPQIANNLTFGKRPVWFRPMLDRRPDAFFVSMSHHGPRLVLNAARVPCTNSLYEVTFRADVSDHRRRVIAVSLISTFAQLSAELAGRKYGSGMLKLEPSDAKKVQILLPKRVTRSTLDVAFRTVDRRLKKGDQDGARDAADSFLAGAGIIDFREIALLRKELNELRLLRLARA